MIVWFPIVNKSGTMYWYSKLPEASVNTTPRFTPSIDRETACPSIPTNWLSTTEPVIVTFSLTDIVDGILTVTRISENIVHVPVSLLGRYSCVPVNLTSSDTGPRVASAGTGLTAVKEPSSFVTTLVKNCPSRYTSNVIFARGDAVISVKRPSMVMVDSLLTSPFLL